MGIYGHSLATLGHFCHFRKLWSIFWQLSNFWPFLDTFRNFRQLVKILHTYINLSHFGKFVTISGGTWPFDLMSMPQWWKWDFLCLAEEKKMMRATAFLLKCNLQNSISLHFISPFLWFAHCDAGTVSSHAISFARFWNGASASYSPDTYLQRSRKVALHALVPLNLAEMRSPAEQLAWHGHSQQPQGTGCTLWSCFRQRRWWQSTHLELGRRSVLKLQGIKYNFTITTIATFSTITTMLFVLKF